MFVSTAKSAKLMALMFCVILIAQLFDFSIFAQEQPITQGFIIDVSDIKVSTIDANGISGSFILSNTTNTVMENFVCSLALNYETLTGSYPVLSFTKVGSLAKYDSKEFSFVSNQKLAFPEGSYTLVVKVLKSSGKTMGVNTIRLDNKGLGNKIILYDVNKSKYTNSDLFQGPLEGPTYQTGVSPILKTTLKNTSNAVLNTTAKIKIYNRSIETNPEPVLVKDLPGTYSFLAAQEKAFDILLPKISVPGSYFANILLYDDSGNVASSIISARYVIAGISGKIADPKVSVENGRLNFSEILIGPADAKVLKGVKTTITVIDEKGSEINSSESFRDIGPFANEVSLSVPFVKKTGFVKIVSKIEYLSSILDTVTIKYSVPELVAEVTPTQALSALQHKMIPEPGNPFNTPDPTNPMNPVNPNNPNAPNKSSYPSVNQEIDIGDSILSLYNGNLSLSQYIIGPSSPVLISGINVTAIFTDENGNVLFKKTSPGSLKNGILYTNFKTPISLKFGEIYVNVIVFDNDVEKKRQLTVYDLQKLSMDPAVELLGSDSIIYCKQDNVSSGILSPDITFSDNKNVKIKEAMISIRKNKLLIDNTLYCTSNIMPQGSVVLGLEVIDADGKQILNENRTVDIPEINPAFRFEIPLTKISEDLTIKTVVKYNGMTQDSMSQVYSPTRLLNNTAITLGDAKTVYYGQFFEKNDTRITIKPVIQETSVEIKDGNMMICEKLKSTTSKNATYVKATVNVVDESGKAVFTDSKSGDISSGLLVLNRLKAFTQKTGKLTINTIAEFGGIICDKKSFDVYIDKIINGKAFFVTGMSNVIYENSVPIDALTPQIDSTYAKIEGGRLFLIEDITSTDTQKVINNLGLTIEVYDIKNNLLCKQTKIDNLSNGILSTEFQSFLNPNSDIKVVSYLEYRGKIIDIMSVEYLFEKLMHGTVITKDASSTPIYADIAAYDKKTAQDIKIISTGVRIDSEKLYVDLKVSTSRVYKSPKTVKVTTKVKDESETLYYKELLKGFISDAPLDLMFQTSADGLREKIIVNCVVEVDNKEVDSFTQNYQVSKIKEYVAKTSIENVGVSYEVPPVRKSVNNIKITDVGGTQFEESVQALVDNDIIKGYPDGTFRPNEIITRAEFIVLSYNLIKAMKKIEASSVKNSFSDLTSRHWAYDIILEGIANGLLKGYPDKSFRPNAKMNYAEAITVCVKLLGNESTNSAYKIWPDDFLKAGNEMNLLPDITFEPRGEAIRGDMAKIIYNVFKQSKVK